MRKGFYSRFALDSLRKNRRYYLPYALTCALMQGLLYIIAAITDHPGLEQMRGGWLLEQFLFFGIWVIAIFSVIFLFYTHSFLMKQRKAEFGLYHVLGMEKRHIGRIVGTETVLMAVGSSVVALGLGLLLNKLALLGLLRLLGDNVPLDFRVSWYGVALSLLLFAAIHLLLYLIALVQIYRSSAISLLRSGQVGEREPKARWLLAVLGVVALGGGYGISLVVEDPRYSVSLFFLAVLLVVAATYLLFTAGSVVWLKLMKGRKHYYYKTRHFINISGMLYRMKQNAASLASICVLSTMVLVTVSATTSLYRGAEDRVMTRYPRQVSLELSFGIEVPGVDLAAEAERELVDALAAGGLPATDLMSYQRFYCYAQLEGDNLVTITESSNATVRLTYVCLEDYNRLAGTSHTLKPGEVLLYTAELDNAPKTLLEAVAGDDTVAGTVDDPIAKSMFFNDGIYAQVGIVTADREALNQCYAAYREGRPNYRNMTVMLGANVPDTEQEERQNAIITALLDEQTFPTMGSYGNTSRMLDFQVQQADEFIATFAGLLFVGLFLSLIFLIATILIIYYKQISEGLQDARRFEIMQKVGLSREEIRGSIRSQVMTVFFLPLAVAGLHCAFAFPIIDRMLALMTMDNTKGFIWCMVICFLIFSVVYVMVYTFTARSYYKIVSAK